LGHELIWPRIPENIIGSPRLGDEIIALCVLIVTMGATAVGGTR
jgi:hypothetical protein